MTAPVRTGLGIDQDTQDIFFDSSGNLVMVRDSLAVGQHVRQRLMTFAGEWFLDTNVGVPWLNEIFAKQYDPALAEAVVKASIYETDGVISIETFSVSFSRTTRNLRISSVDVTTDYDERVSV